MEDAAAHAEHEHHHHHDHDHDEPMTSEEAVRSLLLLGQVALRENDFPAAADAYASALAIEPNMTAAFNLGSLYARGLGVRKNFMEAARLFHQAELLGNEQAGKLCGKCMLDFIGEGLDAKTPMDVYAAMSVFASRVYPEAADPASEVETGLFAIASTYFQGGDYVRAARVFRASAEFCNDGLAQYYLGELYNAGAGVEQSSLAALYWFDCAVDNGAADVALEGRDVLLDALRHDLAEAEFREAIAMLADWCETGSPDVAVNRAKADRWRALLDETL